MKRTFTHTLPKISIALAAAATLGAAQAAPTDYRGVMAGAVFPDSARPVEKGIAAQILWGIPIGPRTALEPNLFGYTQSVDSGGDVRGLGLGIDLVIADRRKRNRPFFLMGLGAQHEDGQGGDSAGPFVNLGVGMVGRLTDSLSWRAEGRVAHIMNDKAVPGQDALNDGRFMIGLQQEFGGPPPVVALPPPKPKPVPKPSLSTEAAPSPQAPAAAVEVPPQDSDGDGVLDANDRCPSSAPGMRVDDTGCAVTQTLVLREIQFATGSNNLKPEAQARLNELAAAMAAQPKLVLEVGGHTDAVGSAESNRVLSLRRAEAVRDELIRQGIEPFRLRAEGYGERYPVASNETVEGRALNRRVEFKVLKR